MLAAISTELAEILGSALALNMLFGLPSKIGSILVSALVIIMLFTNSYKKIEKWIVCFVSLIGLSFLFELSLVHVQWHSTFTNLFVPNFPHGSMLFIMSLLGAVVMPHNLYLHSEIIQSRQWNLEDDKIIEKQLRYEFMDTLLSMLVGFAINSAMIIIAAATFLQIKSTLLNLDRLMQPWNLSLEMLLQLFSHLLCFFRVYPHRLLQVWQEAVYIQAFSRNPTIYMTAIRDMA